MITRYGFTCKYHQIKGDSLQFNYKVPFCHVLFLKWFVCLVCIIYLVMCCLYLYSSQLYYHTSSHFVSIYLYFFPSDDLCTSTCQVIVYLSLSSFPYVLTCLAYICTWISENIDKWGLLSLPLFGFSYWMFSYGSRLNCFPSCLDFPLISAPARSSVTPVSASVYSCCVHVLVADCLC